MKFGVKKFGFPQSHNYTLTYIIIIFMQIIEAWSPIQQQPV